MEHFPSALIIASYEFVCQDNNALYRLVRPLQGGVGVQSTDKLVNVVPFRRKYTFEKKEQLNEFGQQILKRPLVLQPVLHFGRGLGPNCALCYEDELWLIMVNQTHPKILSRLQMGLDSAKAALEKGQPFEIRFRFGKLIQRVYREHLAQKEKGEAQKSSTLFSEYMTYFRYAEWEHCDLNLRYHGYGAHLRSSALRSLPNLEMKWDFEDIGMHEMEWRQLADHVYPRPHLSPVYEDEIRDNLPGWTINSVSPLENIGDSIPENTYDYAQAGRLYASFRKKRRPQNNSHHDAVPGPSSYTNDYKYDEQYQGEDFPEKYEGAVGLDPSVYTDLVDTENEDDFGYDDSDQNATPSQLRQKYSNKDSLHHVSAAHYRDNKNSLEQHLPSNYESNYTGSGAKPKSTNSASYAKSESSNKPEFDLPEVHPDRHGHIHAKVKIISNAPLQHYQNLTTISGNYHGESPEKLYDTLNPSTSDYHAYAAPFKKQDSDRFSRSTNADSGYCPDGDDNHSRGGSFDYQKQIYIPRSKHEYANISHKSDVHDDYGLENPAFSYNSGDMNSDLQMKSQLGSKHQIDVPQQHNINRSGSQKSRAFSHTDSVGGVMKAPPRQKKLVRGSSAVPQVVESFI